MATKPTSFHYLFSFIVINWKAEEITRRAVASIPRSSQGQPNQVIIVDNESEQGRFADLEGVNTIVIRNKSNLGFGKAINIAIPETRGEYIVLLNNDAELQPGWDIAILEIFESDPRVAVAGGLEIMVGEKTGQAGPPLISHLSGRGIGEIRDLPELDVPILSGSNFAIRRSWMEPFDEAYFMYYEDADLCASVLKRGGRIIFSPKPRISHRFNFSGKSAPSKKWYNTYKGKYYFVTKHFEAPYLLAAIPLNLILDLAETGKDLLRIAISIRGLRRSIDREELSARLRGRSLGVLHGLSSLPAALAARRKLPHTEVRYNKLVRELNEVRERALAKR